MHRKPKVNLRMFLRPPLDGIEKLPRAQLRKHAHAQPTRITIDTDALERLIVRGPSGRIEAAATMIKLAHLYPGCRIEVRKG